MAGIIVVAVAALGVGAATAKETSAVGLIGEAVALARACPAVTLDRDVVAMTMARAQIRIAPLMPEIERASALYPVRIAHLDQRAVCRLARQLYGRDGTSGAGFLADR